MDKMKFCVMSQQQFINHKKCRVQMSLFEYTLYYMYYLINVTLNSRTSQ